MPCIFITLDAAQALSLVTHAQRPIICHKHDFCYFYYFFPRHNHAIINTTNVLFIGLNAGQALQPV